MRRHAEIALHAIEGAMHALHAAKQAARESMAMAVGLHIEAEDAEAIRATAATHLIRIDQALVPLELALRSAEAVTRAVDQAEISRFALPVLQDRAGA